MLCGVTDKVFYKNVQGKMPNVSIIIYLFIYLLHEKEINSRYNESTGLLLFPNWSKSHCNPLQATLETLWACRAAGEHVWFAPKKTVENRVNVKNTKWIKSPPSKKMKYYCWGAVLIQSHLLCVHFCPVTVVSSYSSRTHVPDQQTGLHDSFSFSY